MKSSLRKLRGLAHKGDSKEKQDYRHRHRKPARLDELVQATQLHFNYGTMAMGLRNSITIWILLLLIFQVEGRGYPVKVQVPQQSHTIRPSWYPPANDVKARKQELMYNLIIIGSCLACLFILGCVFCCILKRHLQMQATHAALESSPTLGLDRQQIEMFEVSRYASLTGTTIELEECPICQEQYEPDQLRRILPCGHYYHMECIDVWLSSHRTCPVCRTEYP